MVDAHRDDAPVFIMRRKGLCPSSLNRSFDFKFWFLYHCEAVGEFFL